MIQREAEARTTSFWDRSIYNSVKYINKTNKRRRSGGYYADDKALAEIIDEAYDHALKEASYEAFEGKLSVAELKEKVDFNKIRTRAIELIKV